MVISLSGGKLGLGKSHYFEEVLEVTYKIHSIVVYPHSSVDTKKRARG